LGQFFGHHRVEGGVRELPKAVDAFADGQAEGLSGINLLKQIGIVGELGRQERIFGRIAVADCQPAATDHAARVKCGVPLEMLLIKCRINQIVIEKNVEVIGLPVSCSQICCQQCLDVLIVVALFGPMITSIGKSAILDLIGSLLSMR
jgi:hypothetical protein